jgi:hypothetical protein
MSIHQKAQLLSLGETPKELYIYKFIYIFYIYILYIVTICTSHFLLGKIPLLLPLDKMTTSRYWKLHYGLHGCSMRVPAGVAQLAPSPRAGEILSGVLGDAVSRMMGMGFLDGDGTGQVTFLYEFPIFLVFQHIWY